MKKHIRALAVMAAAAALLAAGAAALSGGDGLVSLSHLTAVFQPDAQKRADAAAEQALQDAYDSAEQKLEQLTQDHNGQSGDSRPYSGDLRSRSYARGDVLTIQAGAGVLLIAGDVSVTHDGALVDVTDGKEVPTGSHLAAGHRYLAAEDTTAKLTVRSGLAKVGLQGRYEQKLGGQSAAPFTDVSDGDAWAQAVDHVYRNGLLTGTGDDRFSPGLSMSRAMMMTVFYRLAGSPEGQMAQAEAQFDDVKDGAWFAPYVRWAASQGITSGTSETPPLFSPDMQVTRQQVAVMLYGFASKGLGLKLTGLADLSRYSDGDQVAVWAQTQVAWAVENGIMTAHSGKLEPGADAARGEVAMMVMAFAEKYF